MFEIPYFRAVPSMRVRRWRNEPWAALWHKEGLIMSPLARQALNSFWKLLVSSFVRDFVLSSRWGGLTARL